MEEKGLELKNIFDELPEILNEELFENILETKNLKIERIISKGHISPPNFWYLQPQNEWVILLKGKATLLFKEENEEVNLNSGDYINIPALKKHRVIWTDPEKFCIWLAIHY